MAFVDEDEADISHARRLLENAQIRAMARRQLAFSIPIAIAALFVSIILIFGYGRAGAKTPDQQSAPAIAPRHHHAVALA